VVITTVVDMFVFHVWAGACGWYVRPGWQNIRAESGETAAICLSGHHQSLFAAPCH